MKRFYLFVTVLAIMGFATSCGNNVSDNGSAMLDLSIRMRPISEPSGDIQKTLLEKVSSIFTVLPGPYEFTWARLPHHRYLYARTLKLKLRLDRPIKFKGIRYSANETLEDMLKHAYYFEAFNAEGGTDFEDAFHLWLLHGLWESNGEEKDASGEWRIYTKENTDGLRDFANFLQSEPGTEFELALDGGLGRDIKKDIESTKGVYIEIDPYGDYGRAIEYENQR